MNHMAVSGNKSLPCPGFTSRRPPRNYRWVYAERDGADAKPHGEALRRFISGWR